MSRYEPLACVNCPTQVEFDNPHAPFCSGACERAEEKPAAAPVPAREVGRYSVHGVDRAGTPWTELVTHSLVAAARQCEALQKAHPSQPNNTGRIYWVADDERDGGMVPEDELLEALASEAVCA